MRAGPDPRRAAERRPRRLAAPPLRTAGLRSDRGHRSLGWSSLHPDAPVGRGERRHAGEQLADRLLESRALDAGQAFDSTRELRCPRDGRGIARAGPGTLAPRSRRGRRHLAGRTRSRGLGGSDGWRQGRDTLDDPCFEGLADRLLVARGRLLERAELAGGALRHAGSSSGRGALQRPQVAGRLGGQGRAVVDDGPLHGAQVIDGRLGQLGDASAGGRLDRPGVAGRLGSQGLGMADGGLAEGGGLGRRLGHQALGVTGGLTGQGLGVGGGLAGEGRAVVGDGLLHGAQVAGPGLGQADRLVAGGRLERAEMAGRPWASSGPVGHGRLAERLAVGEGVPGEGLAVGRRRALQRPQVAGRLGGQGRAVVDDGPLHGAQVIDGRLGQRATPPPVAASIAPAWPAASVARVWAWPTADSPRAVAWVVASVTRLWA